MRQRRKGEKPRTRRKFDLVFHLVNLHCGFYSAQRLYSRKATTDKVRRSTFLIFISSLFGRICFIRIWDPVEVSPLFIHLPPPSWMKYECRTYISHTCTTWTSTFVCPPIGPGNQKKLQRKESLVQWTEQMEKVETHLLGARVFHFIYGRGKKEEEWNSIGHHSAKLAIRS